LQVKLKEERAKRAQIDKEEAESLAEKINNVELLIEVKVDPEGRMYGSVSALDIARLFEKEGHTIDRKNVVLPQPIKKLGIYKLNLRLKEGVAAAFTLKVNSDIPLVAQEKEAPQNEIKSEDI